MVFFLVFLPPSDEIRSSGLWFGVGSWGSGGSSIIGLREKLGLAGWPDRGGTRCCGEAAVGATDSGSVVEARWAR